MADDDNPKTLSTREMLIGAALASPLLLVLMLLITR
jgi:hypothetical protein